MCHGVLCLSDSAGDCYLESEADHIAKLDFAFCGALSSGGSGADGGGGGAGVAAATASMLRPEFAQLESTAWLEHANASERQWAALRDATPQAEQANVLGR